MKKPLLVLPLLALLGGGYLWWQQQDSSADASRRLELYGNVDIREAQLAFNASEHIAEILVQEGDRVEQGQLLARLHSELLEAQLAEAWAALEAQRQALAKLEAGSRPEEIRKLRAELQAAEAEAKAARDSYRRMAQLLQKKLASPQDEEQARSEADAAAARVKAVQASLALLEAGARKEDIAAARAQLAARQAAVQQARQRLADASLHAPADGIVRNRILEPGDMAFPQSPVLTLAFLDPVWVRAYLPEPMLGRVRLGASAWITTDSYPDKRYPGWVGYISPTAEFTPKTVQTPELRTRLVYSVRIFACNPEGELRLGMPVSVEIELDQADASSRPRPCGSP
ncbi:efflux RND transporter periplasmic adaptor subunit [Thiohalobacter sp. IOR34]|uniref:efflux RND transporter periplasmic adaptor subunit n=1 Tax=Thiohalobacter sp. IOR34 TaxID=3057176 RepID=UPI0025AFC21F|nr:efflux RND transporter periplasmic adaptor subunit [Thiohalobacter sp. IOR34]WJW75337.1 efflux RND transporter periplasmic adaptor subunit [Thiohalobacter sp. IOR34]